MLVRLDLIFLVLLGLFWNARNMEHLLDSGLRELWGDFQVHWSLIQGPYVNFGMDPEYGVDAGCVPDSTWYDLQESGN